MALLNLTNFDDHPTDPMWMVFRFTDPGMAQEFMRGLDVAGLKYEADNGDEGIRLVAVKQRHRDAAVRINYTVIGHHREPFIGNSVLRWSLLALTALLLLLALMGALHNA